MSGQPLRTLVCCILVGITLVAGAVSGDQLDSMEYSLFVAESTLFVQPDLSPIITTNLVRSLRDGLDSRIDCQISLQRPRRILGVDDIVTLRQSLTLNYDLASSVYRVRSGTGDDSVHLVGSLAHLHRFLADSLTFGVIPIDSLDADAYYRIQITIACVRQTVLNSLTDEDNASSALMYFFCRFLAVTDYGRTEFRVSTPQFSIDRIPRNR